MIRIGSSRLRANKSFRVSTCISRHGGGSVRKRWSSSSSAATTGTGQSSASPLAVISNDLDQIAPRFDISADSIEILQSPADFYEALKAKISRAKRRIYLSTLYIGKTEHGLIETIRTALKANSDLKVSFLTDALRGTREAPDPSCASLLAPLVKEFGPSRVEVCMFHTPNLTGVRKAILPKRINEGWGLQHMKLYGVDDELIMSGANLSNDYFTNRQDRYHVFRSRAITDFFHRVHSAVCKLSYRVVPTGINSGDGNSFTVEWPSTNVQPAPLIDPKGYVNSATQMLSPFVQPPPTTPPTSPSSQSDTQVYAILQLSPLLKPDTSTELPALTSVLTRLSSPSLSGSSWTFTAGYFNMTPSVRDLLLHSNPAKASVVAASPWANGFYGSKGISGMLPAAYTHLSRSFLAAVARAGLGDRISVKEWRRGTVNEPGGWTYHAKGVWITLPGEMAPSVSVVGSSNYTSRSYSLDLEANTLVVTRNERLKQRLGAEERWLQEFAETVTRDDYARTERRVGLHVRVAMWIVRMVGGAL